jgi:hypothetical protein
MAWVQIQKAGQATCGDYGGCRRRSERTAPDGLPALQDGASSSAASPFSVIR